MNNMDEIKNEYNFRKSFYKFHYCSNSITPFSMHNGWSSEECQLRAYRHYIDLIKNNGSILDLGCGNGLLLKFLMIACKVNLIPYGVDFLEELIAEAKQVVVPQFASNFFLENVDTFDPMGKTFTYIITNPYFVIAKHQKEYLRKCYDWVELGGRLILYCYMGSNYFDSFAETTQDWCIERPQVFIADEVILVYYNKS